MSETTSLKYYNESDIQSIADTIRDMTGSTSTLKVSDMSNFLQNAELKDRRVPVDSRGVYVKYFEDISEYRNGVINEADTTKLSTNHTLYPKLDFSDGTDYQNYIFYGFYSDKDYTTYITTTTFSGPAYAMFVPIDFLLVTSIKRRWRGTVEDEKTDLTFVFPILRLAGLSEIGLHLRLKSYTKDKLLTKSNKAYTGSECTDDIDKIKYHAKPNQLYNQSSTYFSVIHVTNIAKANYNYNIYMNAFVISACGTEIEGDTCTFTTADVLNNVYHIPIKLNMSEDSYITDAEFDIQFNPDVYTYSSINELGQFESLVVDDSKVSEGIVHIKCTNSTSITINESIADIVLTPIIDYPTFKPEINILNQKFLNNGNAVLMNMIETQHVNRLIYLFKEKIEATEGTVEAQSENTVSKVRKRVTDGLIEINNSNIIDTIDFSELIQKEDN